MAFDPNRYVVPQPLQGEPFTEFESRMEAFIRAEHNRVWGMTTQDIYNTGIVEIEDE